MRSIPFRTVLVAAVVAASLVAGCVGDDASSDADPADRLEAAADVLDATSGVRFTLTGEDLPDSGTVVIGASGVAAPPASFDGEIRLLTSGLAATVEVISIDGQLWAQLPLTSDFAPIDAAALGFGDPGVLLDPDRGVSLLLRSATDATETGQVRIGGDVFDEVTAVLPGELVGRVLVIADPDAEVQATFALDRATGQMRRAVLVGPFFEDTADQTYTVVLDDYDQAVDIRAPDD